ncbi:MAG: TlpA family protein disulfide reductase [Acidimicrobiia bacterium]
MKRTSIILAVAALAVTGCGTGDDRSAMPDEAFPIVANADLAVGSQRLLVGLFTQDAGSHAAADLAVEIDLYPPEASEPSISVPGVFIWTTPDVRGLYRAQVEFDQPGIWEVALRGEDGTATSRVPFNVAEDEMTPGVGEPAPAVATPTGDEVADLSEISTDPEPDPAFYELSLEEALGSGTPTVVVFATPAFCETATCGPMLDTVKEVSSDYPDINFIHVEVYENLDATGGEDLVLVPAVEEWRLPSEPWTFLVDGDGIIAARFEGTVDTEELADVLGALH